jgi:cobalamin biosynthesis protein CobD/CbiB
MVAGLFYYLIGVGLAGVSVYEIIDIVKSL